MGCLRGWMDSWDLLGLAGTCWRSCGGTATTEKFPEDEKKITKIRRNQRKFHEIPNFCWANLAKIAFRRHRWSSGMLVQSAKCGQWQCWQDTQSCSPPSVWHWSPEIKTQPWPQWWDLLAYLGYFKVGPLWDLNMSRANEGQNATTCYAKWEKCCCEIHGQHFWIIWMDFWGRDMGMGKNWSTNGPSIQQMMLTDTGRAPTVSSWFTSHQTIFRYPPFTPVSRVIALA